MRRSIKKAVAFTLAAVTMFANLSVTAPVKAAEYDEVKEVLPIKYDDYIEFDDGCIFTDYVEAKNGEEQYLNELVIVGSKGEKTTLNVKGSDNTNKYRYVSPGTRDCVYIINDDYTPSIYFADGTWIGNGKVHYDDIYPLKNGNLLVADKDGIHVINRKEEYVKKNIFTNKGHMYMSADVCGDYIIIYESYYVDGEYYSERKILDKNYKEVTGIGHDDCWINTFSDKYFVFTNGKELYFYDSNLKKCIYTFKQNIVTNPSVNAGDGKVLVDYETYCYSFVPNEGGKEYICITVENYYKDVLENPSEDYVHIYLDMETLKEVSEKEITGESEKPYKLENSEITVDSKGDKMDFYYSDKKIADRDSVSKFASDNIKGSTGAWINNTWGYNGDLYLSIYVYYENESANYATLVLEKKSGYSLEKAKFIDKEMSYDCSTYFGGIIKFVDGTYLLNGKEYDEKTILSIKYPWYADSYEESLATMHYVLKTNDGKKVTYTLFDKNHTQVYQSSDMIVKMLPKGLILVAKDVEEDGYTDRIYGCRYAAKTLVSSEDILDELTQVEEGETVEVEIKKNDPVKAEVFETIKGKDVNVVLNLDNGMSWKINGKNVKGDKLTDINLTVDVVKDVVPAAAIDKVNLKGDRIELSLAHNGEFGFSAELTMNVKKENAGKFANRFYYNPETKELEFQEAVKIDTNGDATFTYTHASDYVIILSDVSYETMAGKPGDMANIGALLLILGIGAGATILLQKKRELN